MPDIAAPPLHNRAAALRAHQRSVAASRRARRAEQGLCIICPSPPRPARPGLKTCGECYRRKHSPGQRKNKRISAAERAGIRRGYARRSALLDQAFDLRERAKALDREAAAYTLLALAKEYRCHVATVRKIIDEK